jgi:type VI secretion system protein ImpM
MPCGLFGKLPAKRDFIAVQAPREFLAPWEEWLQGGMTAARLALEAQWLPTFLRAPLWRFWLGPDICGIPVTGAFMASVDGVGRHFPLTGFCCGEAGDRFLGPLDGGIQTWCHKMEEFLLDALEPDLDFDEYLGRLAVLSLPPREPVPEADPGFAALLGSQASLVSEDETVETAFERLLREEARLRHGSASYWWTIGGEGYAPAAVSAHGWPDRNILAAMLSRNFTRAPEQ